MSQTKSRDVFTSKKYAARSTSPSLHSTIKKEDHREKYREV